MFSAAISKQLGNSTPEQQPTDILRVTWTRQVGEIAQDNEDSGIDGQCHVLARMKDEKHL